MVSSTYMLHYKYGTCYTRPLLYKVNQFVLGAHHGQGVGVSQPTPLAQHCMMLSCIKDRDRSSFLIPAEVPDNKLKMRS